MRASTDVMGCSNPYGDDKVIDACSIFGMMNQQGNPLAGQDVVEAMTNMNERTNGLGSGYAVYGLYPKRRDHYALHVMYDDKDALDWGSKFVNSEFEVVHDEAIPMDRSHCKAGAPIMWRYFVDVNPDKLNGLSEDDYVVQRCFSVNASNKGSYVISSGKDMGVFKGVGWPQEIANVFHLDEYRGYLWTAHGRFPTNTRGWWGGAHPFALLDLSVVHNGEISSYGTNRRFLEMLGYQCTFHTDTEILSLSLDFLMRRRHLPIEVIANIFAPPLWKDIDVMQPQQRNLLRRLRIMYGGLLMNGPFSIILARHGLMVGLTDRIKLRPLIAAKKKNVFFLSSEESAIKSVQPDLDVVWHPRGGEPVVARCNNIPSSSNPVMVMSS
jgi:glutamate synthase domain-containing protein 1